MTHVTCRLTAKNRDELRNPTLGNRVWATFTFTVDIKYSAVYFRYVLRAIFLPARRYARADTSYGPVSVCVCLSQVGVLSKRQYEPRRFWHVSFLPPILHLENFTTASQSCCRQTCRRSSLLTTLTTWLNDGRCYDAMYTHLHTVYKLDRSALTPVLRFVVDFCTHLVMPRRRRALSDAAIRPSVHPSVCPMAQLPRL